MSFSLPAVCHTATWLLAEFVHRFHNLLDCNIPLGYETHHLYTERRSYGISILFNINPSSLTYIDVGACLEV